MPITSSILKSRRSALCFDYLGETVNIEYYPAALTAESIERIVALEKQVNDARDAADESAAYAALDEMAAWVSALLASWDYLEDDGVTMVALTPARLRQALLEFPDFVADVIRAVLRHRMQGNAGGTTPSGRSGATSSRMARSTTSRKVSSQNRLRLSASRAG